MSKAKTASAKKAPPSGGKSAAKKPANAKEGLTGSSKKSDGGRGADDAKGAGASEKGSNPKRKLGLRGAAPWAARHAAKHAAEARARAAEPAPPGSARATIRTPSGAEEIKQKIADLHNQVQKIRTLRKRLEKGFYDIGQLLSDIQIRQLYEAKGYGSFEAFLEREIDLGKMTCMKLIKVPTVFQRDAALDFGMDRVFSALSALDGELIPKAIPSAPGSKPGLPMKPPSRLVG